MTMTELYEALWRQKESGYRPYAGYAETTQPLVMAHFTGRWDTSDVEPIGAEPIMEHVTVPQGATVKIVMVSRLGDIGITERLETDYGYGLRVTLESGVLTNCRLER